MGSKHLALVAVLSLRGIIGAQAHSLPTGSDIQVNPPRLAAESANAKLNFLTRQAVQSGVDNAQIVAARSFYYANFLWTKTELKVCFWNGSEQDRLAVMEAASVWTKAVPVIRFDVMEGGKTRTCRLDDLKDYHKMSDIRIGLNANDHRPLWGADEDKSGDWSYPGKVYAQNPNFPTSMNLADVVEMKAHSRLSEYYFTVRHEFGHALGLVHEHQRSVCAGWFNVSQIAKDTGWTVDYAKVQINALPETSNDYAVIGRYDKRSIMQYNFLPSWYAPDRPGQPNPCRRVTDVDDLSEIDKAVIAQLYQPDLNRTPERIALLNESAAPSAAASPAGIASSAAIVTSNVQPIGTTAPPVAGASASQKADVEAALRAFQRDAAKPGPISIQVFPHPADRDVVLRAVSNLGYPLLDASGRPIVNTGHPTPILQGRPTNAVLFTADMPSQDVRYVALALQQQGIQVRSIEPYFPAPQNKFTLRSKLIQIGSSIHNDKRKLLSAEDIMIKPLPMYGDPG